MKIILNDHKVISWNIIYSIKHWSRRKALADEIHQYIFYEAKAKKLKEIKEEIEKWN